MSGGTLDLRGFNQTLNNGLMNAGLVQLGVPGITPPGTILNVAGGYVDVDVEHFGALRLTEAARPVLKGETTLRFRAEPKATSRGRGARRASEAEAFDLDPASLARFQSVTKGSGSGPFRSDMNM